MNSEFLKRRPLAPGFSRRCLCSGHRLLFALVQSDSSGISSERGQAALHAHTPCPASEGQPCPPRTWSTLQTTSRLPAWETRATLAEQSLCGWPRGRPPLRLMGWQQRPLRTLRPEDVVTRGPFFSIRKFSFSNLFMMCVCNVTVASVFEADPPVVSEQGRSGTTAAASPLPAPSGETSFPSRAGASRRLATCCRACPRGREKSPPRTRSEEVAFNKTLSLSLCNDW